MHKILATIAIVGMAFSQTAFAECKDGHESRSDHGAHEVVKNAASGIGTIHRVSRFTRKINLTHAPIPALNWPEMRMDLDVAEGVDLTGLEPGDEISFHLELGDDKVYRITRIEKADARGKNSDGKNENTTSHRGMGSITPPNAVPTVRWNTAPVPVIP